MKKILLILLCLPMIGVSQQPYSGTIFIESDIINSNDSSAIVSTTYTGQDVVIMFDRRVNSWVTVNAFIFNVIWSDGLTSVAQVNDEFGSIALATIEAEKYAFLIGQLPKCLRTDVNEIWIHKGVEPFGGGNNSILIHTGQSVFYENQGILEETLIHEASHTSLDDLHSESVGWLNSQNQDSLFISNYAYNNPGTEDIAESFLTWLAVRYRSSRISTQNFNIITQTIPNRLLYFDNINCNMHPFTNVSTSINQIPNSFLNKKSIRIIDLRGRETKETNQPLFYIYDDGTVEKRIILE